jgi:hypothetical protein
MKVNILNLDTTGMLFYVLLGSVSHYFSQFPYLPGAGQSLILMAKILNREKVKITRVIQFKSIRIKVCRFFPNSSVILLHDLSKYREQNFYRRI